MNEKSAAYERLTRLIDINGGGDVGRSWLADRYEMAYSAGESSESIASSLGIPWFILYRWLLEHSPDSIEIAKGARTEVKMDRAEEELEGCDETTVGVAKAKFDGVLKLAGKRDRKGYGDSVKIENSTTVNVNVRGILEKRNEKLVAGCRVVERIESMPVNVLIEQEVEI